MGNIWCMFTQVFQRTFLFHVLGTFPWSSQGIFCLLKDEETIAFSSTHQTATLSLKTTVSLLLNWAWMAKVLKKPKQNKKTLLKSYTSTLQWILS